VAGRPLGVTSWWRNLANVAAHHAQVLLELWLAGAPVVEVRFLLCPLIGNAEHQAVIDECWRMRGDERRYTVPAKVKRRLCRLAIAHVVELRRQLILRQRTVAVRRALQNQGWTDRQIEQIQSRQVPRCPNVDVPELKKVVEIVSRRAPPGTLRRRARDRILRTKIQSALA
jgi:hypothetical protein